MKAIDLKNSILQLAISGRLVPQDPTDEPASVLYEKIQAERNRLIKEGKIKAPRKDGSKNLLEEPFEIPASWIWVKLGDIVEIKRGKFLSKAIKGLGNVPIILYGELYTTYGNYIKEVFSNTSSDMALKGTPANNTDILMPITSTSTEAQIGKASVLCVENTVYIGGDAIVLSHKLNASYLMYLLNSPWFITEKMKFRTGITISHLSPNGILEVIVPLPPLSEQKRIVEKIEELEPLVNRYGKVAEELARLKTAFPEELRSSILQEAVSGRLVPQDPTDEPASVLYKKIQAEKNRLIKEGKIKQSKLPKLNEPLIPPFQIPDSWVWVRLDDIGQIIGGGTPKTEFPEYWDGDIPWLTPADMKNIKGKFVLSGSRKITKLGLQKSSAQLLPTGSIIYSSRAPIGYLAITKEKLCTNQGFRSIVPYGLIDIEYLYYILQSRFSDIVSRASGTTFLEISGTEFGKTLIPLPPLNEQYRIVKQIESLNSLIDNQFKLVA